MNKKAVVLGAAIAAIVLGSAASYMSADTADPADMRMYGNVSAAMGSPILGDESAPVTIIEFGDYQCHQCYNWYHDTKPAVSQKYIETGKANLVFVDYAFLGLDSAPAAQATHCAGDQEKYWEYHGLLYDSQEQIDDGWANKERLLAFAMHLGLEIEEFASCLDSGVHAKRISYNMDQGREHGVNGTPTFVIVGPDGQQQKLVGAQPFYVFERVLDSMM